jgi:hypothetical protein
MAVQSLCQDPGCCSFSASAGSGKQKGMGDPAALQCIQQGTGDVFLSYEIMKILGTPFASENLILHKFDIA